MIDAAKVLRGTVNGENKYCRIPIRRRRASREETYKFVKESLSDMHEMLTEYSGDEEAIGEINHGIACLLYIRDLLDMEGEEKSGR